MNDVAVRSLDPQHYRSGVHLVASSRTDWAIMVDGKCAVSFGPRVEDIASAVRGPYEGEQTDFWGVFLHDLNGNINAKLVAEVLEERDAVQLARPLLKTWMFSYMAHHATERITNFQDALEIVTAGEALLLHYLDDMTRRPAPVYEMSPQEIETITMRAVLPQPGPNEVFITVSGQPNTGKTAIAAMIGSKLSRRYGIKSEVMPDPDDISGFDVDEILHQLGSRISTKVFVEQLPSLRLEPASALDKKEVRVTIEGGTNVGKTTMAAAIAGLFNANGLTTELVTDPDGEAYSKPSVAIARLRHLGYGTKVVIDQKVKILERKEV